MIPCDTPLPDSFFDEPMGEIKVYLIDKVLRVYLRRARAERGQFPSECERGTQLVSQAPKTSCVSNGTCAVSVDTIHLCVVRLRGVPVSLHRLASAEAAVWIVLRSARRDSIPGLRFFQI